MSAITHGDVRSEDYIHLSWSNGLPVYVFNWRNFGAQWVKIIHILIQTRFSNFCSWRPTTAPAAQQRALWRQLLENWLIYPINSKCSKFLNIFKISKAKAQVYRRWSNLLLRYGRRPKLSSPAERKLVQVVRHNPGTIMSEIITMERKAAVHERRW